MKNYALTLILFSTSIIIILNSCNDPSSEPENRLLAGQQSLINNCSACHNLPNNRSTGIAPPFSQIKEAYITENENDFSETIIYFLNNPTKETAKMKNAVKKNGVMPKMSFSEKELNNITHYLFHTDFENFKKLKKDNIKAQATLNYLEIGRNFAVKTQTELGKNLMKSVKENGPSEAITFCNSIAIVLTDSMANEFKVKIKRVTDKPRNEKNKANEMETKLITEFKNGNQKQGITKEVNNKIVGYYPITTNDMCMKCHGDKTEQINKKTALKISELYPNDEATGYSADQIRGIWVVEMDKK